MAPKDFADPYSVIDRLREGGPVYRGSFREAAGFARSSHIAHTAEVTVLGYDLIQHVLTRPEIFSSRGYALQHDRKLGAPTILSMDDPEHRQHRNLVSAGFLAQSVRKWAAEVVPQVIASLMKPIVSGQGRAELVEEFTSIYPIQVIVGVVGVPETDWPQFLIWIDKLTQIGTNPEVAVGAGEEVQAYLQDLITLRRREPQNDLATELVNADIAGEKLSDPAIVSFLALLLTAGGETTVRATGSTLLGLLQNPGQLERVRANRKLVSQALDEGLRWESPVQLIRRLAVEDTVLGDVDIEAGTHVMLHLGAANHDPARWEDPHRFDMDRPRQTNIAFATGPHFCLGLNLARFEAEAAINAFLDELPNLRLAADARPVVRGLELRGPDTLDILFDPSVETKAA